MTAVAFLGVAAFRLGLEEGQALAAARALLATKDLNHTWMGLSPTCTTCHEDKHRGQLGDNCARCHGHPVENWDRPDMQKMYFEAIRWALRLVDADIAERKTASAYLQELEKLGILKGEKQGREVIYKHPGLLKVLTA